MSTDVKNWVTIRRGKVFRTLATEPENWQFNKRCVHQSNHCELCGTPIVWRYGLQHNNSDKVLWVGRECIKWYYEAYMPDGLEMAIELMKEARKSERAKVIAAKIREWAATGYAWIVNYLFSAESYRDREFRYPDGTKVPVSKFRGSLRRKGYLKDHEIEKFLVGHMGEEPHRLSPLNERDITVNLEAALCG